jgi:serine/threonine protein kinase
MMDIENGQFFGDYLIVSKIGASGMGEVFLAEDKKLGRKVALKILPKEFAEDNDRMNRFIREAKSASALNHPNIITVYEIGEINKTHFIAIEYIQGETLHTLLKVGEIDFKTTLNIVTQIASALDVAHQTGIIHRDIKPENIMIRSDGLVKLLDFGTVKILKKGATFIDKEADTAIKSMSTIPGMIIGTANYMSPEQASGKTIDARSDIFSFGIVLYEMLTGLQAFEGETSLEIISSILKDEPKPVCQINPDIPQEIERIIIKTLRKNRDERYQVIKDVLIDLKDLKQNLDAQNKLEESFLLEKQELKTLTLKANTEHDNRQSLTSKIFSRKAIPKKFVWTSLAMLLVLVTGFIAYKLYYSNEVNMEAMNLYKEGRQLWNKRTAESLKESVKYYQRAIDKDPNFALAYSGMAESYALFSMYGIDSALNSMPKAKENAEIAINLHEKLPGPYAALGLYYSYFEYNREKASEFFEKAIKEDPNYATAHQWYGFELAMQQKFDKAEEITVKAQKKDTESLIIRVDVASVYFFSKRYSTAIGIYAKIIEKDQNYAAALTANVRALFADGQTAKALEEFERLLRIYKELPVETKSLKAFYAYSLAKDNKVKKDTVIQQKIQSLLEEVKTPNKNGYVLNFEVAIIYIGLGDYSKAMDYLEQEVKNKSSSTSGFSVIPELYDLRNEERFKQMLINLNLPTYYDP